MPALRAGAILAGFFLLTLLLIPVQWLFVTLRLPARRTLPHAYHRLVARLFGIRIHVFGAPVTGEGVLLASAHTSYLDIIILSAVMPVSFVSKAEVARWPFFGTLARLQRTVFVERGRRGKTPEARDTIAGRLKAGDAVVLFPEGTSNDGNRILPFKSALLAAAEAEVAGHPVMVQPVSTAYLGLYGMPMGRENRALFAWYGDMDLMPHLWAALKAGPLDVAVEFHPPLSLADMDRKSLAKKAESRVRAGQARALTGRPRVPAQAAPSAPPVA